ncbi:unnamed protein product [Gemmataceae bacterium]|nr:unnamed protein product [Gemmataceae bacterium]VTU02786.1 unnamed protein product [Gemmataceae bacterium]
MNEHTLNVASDVTVTDIEIPDPMPPVRSLSLFEQYKLWMAGQPAWVHVVAVAVSSAVGALVRAYIPELAPLLPF